MEEGGALNIVVLVMGLLFLTTLVSLLAKKTRLPFTVLLVVIGVVLGVVSRHIEPLQGLGHYQLSPDIILYVFLPALIFESAFNLDSRQLIKNLLPIVTLAIPTLLISTAVIGFLFHLAGGLPLGVSFLFGALISATDPVAVIAMFKEMGAPKRLTILVEGESLFNDGTAIVVFKIIFLVVLAEKVTGADIWGGVGDFLLVFFGGVAVGLLIGYVFAKLIESVKNDELVEITFTTILAYTAFIVADHYLKVSGVMATVAAGVTLGSYHRAKISPEVMEFAEKFWEYFAYVCNSLIFVLVGLSVKLEAFPGFALYVLLAIAAIHVARAAGLYPLMPLVCRFRGVEKIGLRFQHVMWWGGLRGAIALALALSLPEDYKYKPLVLTMTLGVVLFTLLVNGLTIRGFMDRLGLNKYTPAEILQREQGILSAKHVVKDELARLFREGAFLPQVMNKTSDSYDEEERRLKEGIEKLRSGQEGIDRRVEGDVFKHQCLNMEKAQYNDLFVSGHISENVMKELRSETDHLLDSLREGRPLVRRREGESLFDRTENRLLNRMSDFPPFQRGVQRYKTHKLAAFYEQEWGLYLATKEVLKEMEKSYTEGAQSEESYNEVRELYRAWSSGAQARMDSIAYQFPEYVEKVQSMISAKLCLNIELEEYYKLADLGIIPDKVVLEMRSKITSGLHQLRKRPLKELFLRPEDLVHQVPFFQELSEQETSEVAGLMAPRSYMTDELIIREGEEGDSFYIVGRGVARVIRNYGRKDEQFLGTLISGNFFGEFALLTAEPRMATVKAVTPCHLLQLKKADMDKTVHHHPNLKKGLEEVYRERVLANALARVPFSQGLTAEERNDLSKHFVPRVIPARTLAWGEGAEEGHSFHFIRRGEAAKIEEEAPGAEKTLKAGDFFGEEAFAPGGIKAGISVRALTELETLKLDREGFDLFLEAHPGIKIGA